MAISTNDAIHKFGTQTDISGTATALVATTALSIINVTTGSNAWTNSDDAPMASVTLGVTFSVAPVAGDSIHLYLRPLNNVSTNDANVPTAAFQDMYVASFPLLAGTAAQWITRTISLPNSYTSQVYEFYFENDTLQSVSAGWSINVTPMAVGGAA